MRELVVLLALALGIAVLAPPVMDAAAKTIVVKLSKEQVATVCGKKLSSNAGVSGCFKKCGANGEHQCDYGCNKKGQCSGQCLTCPQRKFPWGKRYPIHLVKKDVRLAR
jgi:hypothetical protein